MLLIEAETKVGLGWRSFIHEAYETLEQFSEQFSPVTATIENIGYRHGMLLITFKSEYPNLKKLLDLYTLDISRRSAYICEVCGSYGRRRKELLEKPCLCNVDYALLLSNLDDKDVARNGG